MPKQIARENQGHNKAPLGFNERITTTAAWLNWTKLSKSSFHVLP
jgi:hypothetical protein